MWAKLFSNVFAKRSCAPRRRYWLAPDGKRRGEWITDAKKRADFIRRECNYIYENKLSAALLSRDKSYPAWKMEWPSRRIAKKKDAEEGNYEWYRTTGTANSIMTARRGAARRWTRWRHRTVSNSYSLLSYSCSSDATRRPVLYTRSIAASLHRPSWYVAQTGCVMSFQFTRFMLSSCQLRWISFRYLLLNSICLPLYPRY